MNRLFWGLFFVVLDYQVKIGTAVVEILPDFVGFYLLMRGMERLGENSPRFERGRHGAFAMALASALLFGADLLNPDTHTKVWLWAAGVAALAAGLGLVRCAVLGLDDLGKKTENLKSMWLILTVLQMLCGFVSWIPLVGDMCAVVDRKSVV